MQLDPMRILFDITISAYLLVTPFVAFWWVLKKIGIGKPGWSVWLRGLSRFLINILAAILIVLPYKLLANNITGSFLLENAETVLTGYLFYIIILSIVFVEDIESSKEAIKAVIVVALIGVLSAGVILLTSNGNLAWLSAFGLTSLYFEMQRRGRKRRE